MSLSVQARAPVRIDFAGGWSDVPDFAEREGGGGAVVNAAISLYTRVECLVGGGKFRLHAEDLELHAVYSSPLELVYDGKLDLHKAALNMLPVLGGVELITTCDVPPGSGLGASGALDVALLHALALCRGENYAPLELAEMGFLVEASELKLAGGRQDQLAGALLKETDAGHGTGSSRLRRCHCRRLRLIGELLADAALAAAPGTAGIHRPGPRASWPSRPSHRFRRTPGLAKPRVRSAGAACARSRRRYPRRTPYGFELRAAHG